MNKEKYLDDISEIKMLMTKSSGFYSLTSLSGIATGLYSLVGSSIIYWLFKYKYNSDYLHPDILKYALVDLIIVGLLSIATSILLTKRQAKLNRELVWSTPFRKMIKTFSVIFGIGCIVILNFLLKEEYERFGALMLIFYGLALISSSKYTFKEVMIIGYIHILLGILATFIPEYSFWLGVTGFGIVHLLFGIVMFLKNGN